MLDGGSLGCRYWCKIKRPPTPHKQTAIRSALDPKNNPHVFQWQIWLANHTKVTDWHKLASNNSHPAHRQVPLENTKQVLHQTKSAPPPPNTNAKRQTPARSSKWRQRTQWDTRCIGRYTKWRTLHSHFGLAPGRRPHQFRAMALAFEGLYPAVGQSGRWPVQNHIRLETNSTPKVRAKTCWRNWRKSYSPLADAEEEDTEDDSVVMLLLSLLCSIFNQNGCGSRFVFCCCRRRTVAEPWIFKFQILIPEHE